MLNFILSENCHLVNHGSAYFCNMIKLILPALVLLISISACNNQDHTNKTGSTGATSATGREKTLLDSIASFPDFAVLKENLIQFYRDSAEYDKALAVANDALQKDSTNDKLWEIKATLFFENEDTLNAIRSFETALRLNPTPRYLVLLGSLYAQTKNSRAIQIADTLLSSKIPEAAEKAFFIKGLYFNFTGDKNKAIGFLDKSLLIDHMDMLAYRERGIALYDMGKYEDALAVLKKAVTLQNNFDEGYYWLGRCYEKLNKPTEAFEAYKTALLYSPDYVEATDALKRLNTK